MAMMPLQTLGIHYHVCSFFFLAGLVWYNVVQDRAADSRLHLQNLSLTTPKVCRLYLQLGTYVHGNIDVSWPSQVL